MAYENICSARLYDGKTNENVHENKNARMFYIHGAEQETQHLIEDEESTTVLVKGKGMHGMIMSGGEAETNY